MTISGLAQLRPVIGHSNINAYVWRLELRNLRFPNNGPLPYDRVFTVFVISWQYVNAAGSFILLESWISYKCKAMEERQDNLLILRVGWDLEAEMYFIFQVTVYKYRLEDNMWHSCAFYSFMKSLLCPSRIVRSEMFHWWDVIVKLIQPTILGKKEVMPYKFRFVTQYFRWCDFIVF